MERNRSRQAFEEACRHIPGGVNSPVRAFRSVGGVPVFVERAEGSRLWDIDGNEYIDCIGSWGPMILGHASPLLTGPIQSLAQAGISYGLPTTGETQMAALIGQAYPCAELVRMVNSGTEATMSAIRAARGYTGRDKILKFEGCYHGHSDYLLVKAGSGALTFGTPTSPGVPADVVKNTLVARYNDLASVRALFEANPGQIACVILEPIAGNMGLVPGKAEFLAGLRQICDEEGALLIFDEVISGFRSAWGGAAGVYGVTPDMVCFGKIIGAGMPVGAYGGRRKIMEMVSPAGPVYQAGTLAGNPLAMGLGLTLLGHLGAHPEVYQSLEEKGRYLADGLRTIVGTRPWYVAQSGSLLTLFFAPGPVECYEDAAKSDTQLFARWHRRMLEAGILLAPSQFECIFLSDAHTRADLDAILNAAESALKGE